MTNITIRSLALTTCFFCTISTYAAKPIDLAKQPMSALKAWLPGTSINSKAPAVLKSGELKELSRGTDRNQTTHIRVQQLHQGYPVWGADAVVHLPSSGQKKQSLLSAAGSQRAGSSMNGVVYQDLSADLSETSQQVFSKDQADQALNKAVELSRETYGAGHAKPVKNQLMVYVGQDKQAHWAYLVSLYIDSQHHALPTYILDASTLAVYRSWNDRKTSALAGGGVGGNKKTGQFIYDGASTHLGALDIRRNPAAGQCLLANDQVEIYSGNTATAVMGYACAIADKNHNNVFWNNTRDEANGGYSPADDALYAGSIVQSLYKQWIGVPMLVAADGKPMTLKMYVHYLDYNEPMENAEWDPVNNVVHLGDGAEVLYPLTSLGVVAHEVSHGFTQQHSNLVYDHQSGGMNESFSDMAAIAAEEFATGHHAWEIGPEIFKENNQALRYMDQPSKDCANAAPGYCSIDHVSAYTNSLNVHYTSGIYNRVFYLLSTSEGWDVRQAFVVMTQANAHYWTANTTYLQGACGVMKATADYQYDNTAVVQAFSKVGIDVKQC
tara:strand:- start:1202 stop:2860 length:1659 start_codon:yes stop_codon:yes gene_type:complete